MVTSHDSGRRHHVTYTNSQYRTSRSTVRRIEYQSRGEHGMDRRIDRAAPDRGRPYVPAVRCGHARAAEVYAMTSRSMTGRLSGALVSPWVVSRLAEA